MDFYLDGLGEAVFCNSELQSCNSEFYGLLKNSETLLLCLRLLSAHLNGGSMKRFLHLILIFIFMAPLCNAAPLCFERAGRDYNIHPLILKAIAIQESRLNNDAVNDKNANQTTDICAMQVNSSNFDRLQEVGVPPRMLVDDPCMCVYAGAWILARFIKKMGNNWEAVGAYNAGAKDSPSAKARRKKYSDNIKAIYLVLSKYEQK